MLSGGSRHDWVRNDAGITGLVVSGKLIDHVGLLDIFELFELVHDLLSLVYHISDIGLNSFLSRNTTNLNILLTCSCRLRSLLDSNLELLHH